MRTLKLIALAVLAGFLMLFVPLVAFAATPIGPDSTSDSLFGIEPFYVELLLGSVIPFLVSWVTASDTAAWFKKVAALLLSGVVGLITVGLTDDGGAVISSSAAKAAALAFIGATVSYINFVRKTKVEGVLQDSGFAVGPKTKVA